MQKDLQEENRLSWNTATVAHNSHKGGLVAFVTVMVAINCMKKKRSTLTQVGSNLSMRCGVRGGAGISQKTNLTCLSCTRSRPQNSHRVCTDGILLAESKWSQQGEDNGDSAHP